MAKAKDINDAFLTTRTKNDSEVEKATRRNINRIHDDDKNEIHTNLLKVLNIKTPSDSKYFDLSSFSNLINKIREEKRTVEREKNQLNNN